VEAKELLQIRVRVALGVEKSGSRAAALHIAPTKPGW
jgi:hypothetical protein